MVTVVSKATMVPKLWFTMVKLVSLWFITDIAIVTMVSKPTNITRGAPPYGCVTDLFQLNMTLGFETPFGPSIYLP
jgi:hypothetical protein